MIKICLKKEIKMNPVIFLRITISVGNEWKKIRSFPESILNCPGITESKFNQKDKASYL